MKESESMMKIVGPAVMVVLCTGFADYHHLHAGFWEGVR